MKRKVVFTNHFRTGYENYYKKMFVTNFSLNFCCTWNDETTNFSSPTHSTEKKFTESVCLLLLRTGVEMKYFSMLLWNSTLILMLNNIQALENPIQMIVFQNCKKKNAFSKIWFLFLFKKFVKNVDMLWEE